VCRTGISKARNDEIIRFVHDYLILFFCINQLMNCLQFRRVFLTGLLN